MYKNEDLLFVAQRRYDVCVAQCKETLASRIGQLQGIRRMVLSDRKALEAGKAGLLHALRSSHDPVLPAFARMGASSLGEGLAAAVQDVQQTVHAQTDQEWELVNAQLTELKAFNRAITKQAKRSRRPAENSTLFGLMAQMASFEKRLPIRVHAGVDAIMNSSSPVLTASQAMEVAECWSHDWCGAPITDSSAANNEALGVLVEEKLKVERLMEEMHAELAAAREELESAIAGAESAQEKFQLSKDPSKPATLAMQDKLRERARRAGRKVENLTVHVEQLTQRCEEKRNRLLEALPIRSLGDQAAMLSAAKRQKRKTGRRGRRGRKRRRRRAKHRKRGTRDSKVAAAQRPGRMHQRADDGSLVSSKPRRVVKSQPRSVSGAVSSAKSAAKPVPTYLHGMPDDGSWAILTRNRKREEAEANSSAELQEYKALRSIAKWTFTRSSPQLPSLHVGTPGVVQVPRARMGPQSYVTQPFKSDPPPPPGLHDAWRKPSEYRRVRAQQLDREPGERPRSRGVSRSLEPIN